MMPKSRCSTGTAAMPMLRGLVLVAALSLAGASHPLIRAHAESAPSSEAMDAARDLLALISRDLVDQFVTQVTAQMWPSIESRLRAYNSNIDAAALADLRKEL